MSEHKTPLGHSIPSHYLFGWCAGCRYKTYADEMLAWRAWSMTQPEILAEVERQQTKH